MEARAKITYATYTKSENIFHSEYLRRMGSGQIGAIIKFINGRAISSNKHVSLGARIEHYAFSMKAGKE